MRRAMESIFLFSSVGGEVSSVLLEALFFYSPGDFINIKYNLKLIIETNLPLLIHSYSKSSFITASLSIHISIFSCPFPLINIFQNMTHLFLPNHSLFSEVELFSIGKQKQLKIETLPSDTLCAYG